MNPRMVPVWAERPAEQTSIAASRPDFRARVIGFIVLARAAKVEEGRARPHHRSMDGYYRRCSGWKPWLLSHHLGQQLAQELALVAAVATDAFAAQVALAQVVLHLGEFGHGIIACLDDVVLHEEGVHLQGGG